jgi:hypothetical protein
VTKLTKRASSTKAPQNRTTILEKETNTTENNSKSTKFTEEEKKVE